MHDFYADIMMGDQCSNTVLFYPEHFPRVKFANTPMYDINEMMKVPYYHKEGQDQPELRARLHREFYAYFCCIYDLVMPDYMVYDKMTLRTFRNNFVRRFNDNGDQMSTTSPRLTATVKVTVLCRLAWCSMGVC